ncbi:hypothetical protein [Hugenholtzia roseola]|uniref:hypothetical protein n=1 Tax=Hugenholtzia roseola TaxID=1002 RepID=UPI000405E129|nr:hypothetical protein [Hugenholtzia roseola]
MYIKLSKHLLFCSFFCLIFIIYFSPVFAASSEGMAVRKTKLLKKANDKSLSLNDKKIDAKPEKTNSLAKKIQKKQARIEKMIRKKAEKEQGNGRRSAIIIGTGLLVFCLPLPYMLTTLGVLTLIGICWGFLLLIGGLFANRPWRFATQIFWTFVDILILLYSVF